MSDPSSKTSKTVHLSDKEAEQLRLALSNRAIFLRKVIEATPGEGFMRYLDKQGRTNVKCQRQLAIVNDLIGRI